MKPFVKMYLKNSSQKCYIQDSDKRVAEGMKLNIESNIK